MKNTPSANVPDNYSAIKSASKKIGFSMPSDLLTGSLLKTLVTAKPASRILELGTGTGLSLSWIADGMDTDSQLITIDNDPQLLDIARNHYQNDERITIICEDAAAWLKNYAGDPFDIIFADAWPGKYSHLDTTLDLLEIGGLYIIDDMSPQPNWPDGHAGYVQKLITYLEERSNITISKLNCSSGIIIAAKNTSKLHS